MKSIVYLFFIILLELFVSCKSEKTNDYDIVDATDYQTVSVCEVFDSLELIRLNTDFFIGRIKDIRKYEDYFFFVNQDNILFVFDSNGEFISSSYKILGHGKGEVASFSGFSFNNETNLVEIITPTSIMFYDISLNFIKQVKYPNSLREEPFFSHIYDLSSSKHVLLTEGDNPLSDQLFVFDSESGSIEKSISFEDYVIAPFSYQYRCFVKSQDITYAFLPYLTDCLFLFDEKSLELKPVISLDFKNLGLDIEDLRPFDGQDSFRKIMYLCKCNKQIPVMYGISGEKLFVLVHNTIQALDWYYLIVNLEDNSVVRVNRSVDMRRALPVHFDVSDGYFYSVVTDEEELLQYVSYYGGTLLQNNDSIENQYLLKYRIKE